MDQEQDIFEKIELIFNQIKKHSYGLSDFQHYVNPMHEALVLDILEKRKPAWARDFFREFNWMLREGAMTSQSIKIRDRILADSGLDIFDGLKKDITLVQAIRKRGKIRNLAEYALITEAMNTIGGLEEADAQREANVLDALLDDYHRRVGMFEPKKI